MVLLLLACVPLRTVDDMLNDMVQRRGSACAPDIREMSARHITHGCYQGPVAATINCEQIYRAL